MERLISAMLQLKDAEEFSAFLRDVCTHSELTEMARRFAAAELLHRGTPVRRVADQTGLSTTTVSRVSHWKKHGEGGYDLVISRLSPDA